MDDCSFIKGGDERPPVYAAPSALRPTGFGSLSKTNHFFLYVLPREKCL